MVTIGRKESLRRYARTHKVEIAVKHRTWVENNREHNRERKQKWKENNVDKVAAAGKRYQHRNISARMVAAARNRARWDKVPFDIRKEDIIIPLMCPVLGIPIGKGENTPRDNWPNLDRIIPKLGYVRGNIAVISGRANRIKSDGTAEEHEAVARYIRGDNR
jgi:hypothetical protein